MILKIERYNEKTGMLDVTDGNIYKNDTGELSTTRSNIKLGFDDCKFFKDEVFFINNIDDMNYTTQPKIFYEDVLIDFTSDIGFEMLMYKEYDNSIICTAIFKDGTKTIFIENIGHDKIVFIFDWMDEILYVTSKKHQMETIPFYIPPINTRWNVMSNIIPYHINKDTIYFDNKYPFVVDTNLIPDISLEDYCTRIFVPLDRIERRHYYDSYIRYHKIPGGIEKIIEEKIEE